MSHTKAKNGHTNKNMQTCRDRKKLDKRKEQIIKNADHAWSYSFCRSLITLRKVLIFTSTAARGEAVVQYASQFDVIAFAINKVMRVFLVLGTGAARLCYPLWISL